MPAVTIADRKGALSTSSRKPFERTPIARTLQEANKATEVSVRPNPRLKAVTSAMPIQG